MHEVVFTEQDILQFGDNVHLLKCYPVNVPQDCFISLYFLNQTGNQVFKFPFALKNYEN